MNYDDTVRFAQRQARERGWILVQDAVWEGYERIIFGESGAVTSGLLHALLTEKPLAGLKEPLGLKESSRVLCISAYVQGKLSEYRMEGKNTASRDLMKAALLNKESFSQSSGV
ncbi:MAG: hypothetical protein HFE83_00255 [Lachnospiraceae bacterium]|nr:hypothetical protein [Lachnospiraceae bacterium]